ILLDLLNVGDALPKVCFALNVLLVDRTSSKGSQVLRIARGLDGVGSGCASDGNRGTKSGEQVEHGASFVRELVKNASFSAVVREIRVGVTPSTRRGSPTPAAPARTRAPSPAGTFSSDTPHAPAAAVSSTSAGAAPGRRRGSARRNRSMTGTPRRGR